MPTRLAKAIVQVGLYGMLWYDMWCYDMSCIVCRVPNGWFGGIGRNRMMQSRKRLSKKNTKGKTTCRHDGVVRVKADGGLEVGIDRSG
ncbi:hypothetical protein COCHEDRAFT_1151002 [Bipolaris maydis C5]|uniref:Uncharacterized protein n=1 Tax=Cochliobolus heterostrophus (strain C5 / ATCC 48332 / race O) TaxID=701091 RepID=M2VBQ7_COCH5|nr:hypothetical protein COCHEDRAFT_1151002 [Bipolaris maydis C5]